MIQEIQISKLLVNEKNPRNITNEKLAKLKDSIIEFPEMLKLRPIVVNNDMVVLGGNMRLKACKEIGLKKVWITKAENLTKEQQQQFIIKDNLSFGVWDFEILEHNFKNDKLNDWGMDLWSDDEEIDYSVLDELELDDDITNMTKGVKRAIMVEFDLDKYDVALNLIKHFKQRGKDIGVMLINFLESEKKNK